MICLDCNTSQYQPEKCTDCKHPLPNADHDPDGMKFWTGCRNIFLVAALLFFLCMIIFWLPGCGSGGGTEQPQMNHGTNGNPRFVGDSMALGLEIHDGQVRTAYDWKEKFPNAQIDGISGATLETILANLDRRKTVIAVVFAGFNNLKHPEQSINTISASYAQLIGQLPVDKFYCIGVPLSSVIDDNRIKDFNKKVKTICGDNYIDTVKLLDCHDTSDGVHPNESGYRKIAEELYNRGIR